MLRVKQLFNNSENSFYLLLALTAVALLFTNPLLIYPYDVYTHLQWIDRQDIGELPSTGRELWHYIWTEIFHFFHIDNRDIFLRAYIIHFTQIFISLFSLLYFGRIFMRSLFVKIDPLELNYLSYWSTLIWFTLFATYSEGLHQVWILWYSVNYQITLPLTFLVTALTISLIFETLTLQRILFYTLLIALLSYFILRAHAMEYLYYLMYMSVLTFVYADKIIKIWRKNIYYSIPVTLAVIFGLSYAIYFAKTTAYQKSPIFNYLSFDKIPELLAEINARGGTLLAHYNRVWSSINELMILSLVLISILLILIIYRNYKKFKCIINIRMAIFLFITSFFIVIPLTKFTGGIASLITYPTVAYRFYYSSLLFLAIPLSVFYIYTILKIKKMYILNILILFTVLGTFYYSKHISEKHNYYKNIISIKNAFNKKKMSFNLSNKEIILIGTQLKHYESLNKTNKKEYYYARDDIAFIIKFIYRKPVQYYRRGSINYQKNFYKHKNKRYYPILFETPENFPSYQRFK